MVFIVAEIIDFEPWVRNVPNDTEDVNQINDAINNHYPPFIDHCLLRRLFLQHKIFLQSLVHSKISKIYRKTSYRFRAVLEFLGRTTTE